MEKIIQLPKQINRHAKTAVYIDVANMFYLQKTAKFEIDYKKLYALLIRSFDIRSIRYYTGYDTENVNQIKFLAKLRRFGYTVVCKPVKHINAKGKRIDKANLDVELAVDAITECDSFMNFILASGDSDFTYLLKKLRENGKNVYVLSARGHISKELRQVADKYIPIEKLKQEIGSI